MTDPAKRVNRYYRTFRKAKEAMDTFMVDNGELMDQLDQLTEEYNVALSRFQKVCREERTGMGPISASTQRKPVYNGDYLYELLSDRPAIRDELITVEFKVKRGVFEKLAADGELTQSQVRKGVAEVRETVVLKGVPGPLNLL